MEIREGYPISGTQSILTMLLIGWLLSHTDGRLGALSPSCNFSASFLSKQYTETQCLIFSCIFLQGDLAHQLLAS